jgi:hypothetical protein
MEKNINQCQLMVTRSNSHGIEAETNPTEVVTHVSIDALCLLELNSPKYAYIIAEYPATLKQNTKIEPNFISSPRTATTHKNPEMNRNTRNATKFFMNTDTSVEIVDPSSVDSTTILLPCVSAKNPNK